MIESMSAASSGTNLGLRIELDHIRSRGPRSLAHSVADALRHAVRGGRLPAGTLLPASRSLAVDLEVSRGVVVRAYEQLVAEGYLQARAGRGTTVSAVHATAGTVPPSVARGFVPTNPGLPSLGAFPRTEWLRSMESAMRELPNSDLGYGDPRGHPRLRRALAAYLGRTRAVVAPVDQIVVTGGFAQAVRLGAEALVRHGVHAIGVEDPGSVGVIETLRAGGLATRPVPVDEHGIDVGELAAGDLRAVMVTPAHQFPTGAVLGSAPAGLHAVLVPAAPVTGAALQDMAVSAGDLGVVPLAAYAQGRQPHAGLVVGYGGATSDQIARGIAAMAARTS